MFNRKTTYRILLIFAFSFTLLFSYQAYQGLKRKIFLEKKLVILQELQEKIADRVSGFKGETGVLIEDLESGQRIAFGDEKLFASASLVKIPIMAACFYAVQQGKIDLGQSYPLRDKDKVSGSGELKGIAAGSEFSLLELLEFMIVKSDNTATNIIIDILGFDYLNHVFKVLGLKNTNLSRKMMDFKSRKKGIENYTDCQDLAHILGRIYEEKLINREISRLSLEFLKQQEINDRIPAKLPSQTMVAHKTGLERGICHDAGIVFTEKGDFLICVLTRHANKSSRLSKRFISELALLTYNFYQRI